MANRGRCASPGSIRSPGECRQRCDRGWNTLARSIRGRPRSPPHACRADSTVPRLSPATTELQKKGHPRAPPAAKPRFRSHDGGITHGPCHAPFAAFPVLGSSAGGHRPERSRHRRDGPRPGPADPRWHGWSRLRRRGAARRRLRPGRAGPRSSCSRGSGRRRRGRAGFWRRGAARRRLRPSRARACSSCSRGSRRRRRGRAGFRRRGPSWCRLRAAGPRALNSWSRKVRHSDPGWPPELPEPSAPVRPRRLIAARVSARPAAPDPAPPPHRPTGNRRPQGSISAAAAVRA